MFVLLWPVAFWFPGVVNPNPWSPKGNHCTRGFLPLRIAFEQPSPDLKDILQEIGQALTEHIKCAAKQKVTHHHLGLEDQPLGQFQGSGGQIEERKQVAN